MTIALFWLDWKLLEGEDSASCFSVFQHHTVRSWFHNGFGISNWGYGGTGVPVERRVIGGNECKFLAFSSSWVSSTCSPFFHSLFARPPGAHSKGICLRVGMALASSLIFPFLLGMFHFHTASAWKASGTGSSRSSGGLSATQGLWNLKIPCTFIAGLILDCEQLDCFRNKVVVSSKCLMDCGVVGIWSVIDVVRILKPHRREQ